MKRAKRLQRWRWLLPAVLAVVAGLTLVVGLVGRRAHDPERVEQARFLLHGDPSFFDLARPVLDVMVGIENEVRAPKDETDEARRARHASESKRHDAMQETPEHRSVRYSEYLDHFFASPEVDASLKSIVRFGCASEHAVEPESCCVAANRMLQVKKGDEQRLHERFTQIAYSSLVPLVLVVVVGLVELMLRLRGVISPTLGAFPLHAARKVCVTPANRRGRR